MYRLLTSLRALLRKSILDCFSVALLLALSCVAASAQTQDQPIHIEADHAQYSDKTGVSTYTGEVLLRQGALILHGNELTVSRDKKNGNITAALVGNPATLTKTADAKDSEPVNGHSKRMEYNSSQAVVVLRGDAFVERGGDTISGEVIRHHLNSARTEAQRADNGERVKITIQPKTVEQSESGAVKDETPAANAPKDAASEPGDSSQINTGPQPGANSDATPGNAPDNRTAAPPADAQ